MKHSQIFKDHMHWKLVYYIKYENYVLLRHASIFSLCLCNAWVMSLLHFISTQAIMEPSYMLLSFTCFAFEVRVAP